MINTEPMYQDRVKHKNGEVSGTVIAKYGWPFDRFFLDVHGDDDRIYYGTPITNWITIEPEEI